MRPKTLAGYQSSSQVHLLPTFGARPVGSLRPLNVRACLAAETRAGVGAATIRNAYRVLRPILDTAVEAGCLRANPCAVLRRDDMPRIPRTEMNFLTADEVARLAAATREPYGVLIGFAARTGLRAGEIGALRMAQVDLLRGRVRVEASRSDVGGTVHRLPPKSGEAREFVLPASLVWKLREYIVTGPAKGPGDYLFTPPGDPAAPIRHNSWFYRAIFKPAAKAARLPATLRFHNLRHTCASLLIAQNVSAKAISEHLGQTGIAITLDRYGHRYPDAREAVGAALERAFAPTGVSEASSDGSALRSRRRSDFRS